VSFEQWILLILSAAGSVGGAIWAVARFIIPRIVEARIKAADDEREYRQQREREERAERKRQTETRELEVTRDKAEALSIAREMIEWGRGDFSVMQHTMEQQVRILEQIRENIRILAGEVARLADGLKRGERENDPDY
jgi:hypothetical protein